MVHKLTGHMATSQKDVQEQAPPSHKGAQPKDIVPKGTDHQPRLSKQRKPVVTDSDTPKALVFVEVIAGTALAFVVQLFQLRRKK